MTLYESAQDAFNAALRKVVKEQVAKMVEDLKGIFPEWFEGRGMDIGAGAAGVIGNFDDSIFREFPFEPAPPGPLHYNCKCALPRIEWTPSGPEKITGTFDVSFDDIDESLCLECQGGPCTAGPQCEAMSNPTEEDRIMAITRDIAKRFR